VDAINKRYEKDPEKKNVEINRLYEDNQVGRLYLRLIHPKP
jgi:hypothetical protein